VKQMKRIAFFAVMTALVSIGAEAAQLSSDAKSAIPKDAQQIIVVDYHTMQNSKTAMDLKDKVLQPEIKRLETALIQSGLKVSDDADVVGFAAFRIPGSDGTKLVGIAQGQFQTAKIMATFSKNKTKPVVVRNSSIYPMGSAGMSVVFLNQTTMIFGELDAVKSALDARDGIIPNLLSNSDMLGDMVYVDKRAVWSLLDQSGTQTLMKTVVGEASQVADYKAVNNSLRSSRYMMDFSNGVKFDMNIVTSDSMTSSTAATLMKAAILVKKNSGSDTEKAALNNTTVDSNGGTLIISFSADDNEFSKLLASPLFQAVVK
jgi:uncharacterized protein YjfI (DUF2170 family)